MLLSICLNSSSSAILSSWSLDVVDLSFSAVTWILVVLDSTPLWIFRVDVQRDADTECWTVLLFGFVEKIAFLAEENAGAPSFRAIARCGV